MMIDLCAECCKAVVDSRMPTMMDGERIDRIPFSLATQIMRGTVIIERRDPGRRLDMVAMTTINGTRLCAWDANPEVR